jgi:toluene monooxygenase system ferredoxin subunit
MRWPLPPPSIPSGAASGPSGLHPARPPAGHHRAAAAHLQGFRSGFRPTETRGNRLAGARSLSARKRHPNQETPMSFTKVCTLDDVWEGRDGPLHRQRPREILLVCAEGGEIKAFQGVCPHQDIALAEGKFDGKKVICRAHLWQFDASTGKGINPDDCALAEYPVKRGGRGRARQHRGSRLRSPIPLRPQLSWIGTRAATSRAAGRPSGLGAPARLSTRRNP